MTLPAYATCTQVAHVARVSVTVTARVVSFTDARCPGCNRKLMAIPGHVVLHARTVSSDAARSGRGRVVSCHRCKALVEVIEYR